jgi:hypothetical protein
MNRIGRWFLIALLAGACLLPSLAIGQSGQAIEALDGLSGSSPNRIYKTYRDGLRVRLEVRGDEIVSTGIWVLRRCSDGFEAASGLSLQEPDQAIPIRPDGRFEFKWFNLYERTRLAGRVSGTKISGFYLEWEQDSKSVCGTGRPGKRAMHFVAHRIPDRHVPGAPGGTYAMERPELEVELELHGDEILPAAVRARSRCSNGSRRHLGLVFSGPGYEIKVDRQGRFELKRLEKDKRTHLWGRIRHRKVTGYFSEWNRDLDRVCATGRPGHRALRFIAHRVE